MDYEFYALSAYNKLSEGWPLRSRSTLDSLYLGLQDQFLKVSNEENGLEVRILLLII